ncbi:YoaK family protein [Demequina sp. NBRC 110056]|uniref:YoaK family protein n=1 Tax=Demequina sp. NBRC 110056 TaxID=1570345 RepID=UPI001F1640D3|nr:YoaK family protein [Demequina sp. NBRC 110056]
MRERLRRDVGRTHLGLMLALTFSTGVIDAVGYLGLDRVFTGNMTGNVVILGMGLTGVDGLPVLGPILALVGFMAGAAVGGRTLRTFDAGWSHKTTVLFSVVAAVLIASAIIALFETEPPHPLALAITTALGAAMGLQAAVARHIAVKDVTTVVVTSTITGLAADSAAGGEGLNFWRRRMGAILLIGAGACAGALLLQVHIAAGMLLSAAITVAVTIVGHHSRPQPDLVEATGL